MEEWVQGSEERKSPTGVQDQSSGKRSGWQSPGKLMVCVLNYSDIVRKKAKHYFYRATLC